MTDLSHAFVAIFASLATLFHSPPPAPPPPVPKPAQVSVLFGGDMMFDRFIRQVAAAKGGDFVFSCLDPLLSQQEFVVANLEGPITPKSSQSTGTAPGSDGNFTFTFPTSTGGLLSMHHIDLVNLGNNHILNFGTEGASSTMAALANAGVGYFGDPINHGVSRHDQAGVPLSFINYNGFGGDATTAIDQIREERTAGRLPIVYTHWGVEYATTSSEKIQNLAHRFVDAGAELIIGSHPHVVQEREFYADKYIYYSLGNLIFDQYWEDEVRHGLMVRTIFDASGVLYVEEIPVQLEKDGRTCPIQEVHPQGRT